MKEEAKFYEVRVQGIKKELPLNNVKSPALVGNKKQETKLKSQFQKDDRAT